MNCEQIAGMADDSMSMEEIQVTDTGEILEELYNKYSGRVFSFAKYRLHNVQEAQELTQTVFEKVVKSYHSFNPNSNFEVWLFAIARNELSDYYRRRSRAPITSLDSLPAPPSSEPLPEQQILKQELEEGLARALDRLSEREQAVISLKYGGRLKNTEIAGVMGISSANTGIILHRSIKKLQRFLEEEKLI